MLLIIFLFISVHCAGKLTTIYRVTFIFTIDILTHPISQNVSVNTTITFTCTVSGNFPPAFLVNMTNAAEPSVANKGFDLLVETLFNGTVTRSLMVTAFADNNNTNITCLSSSNTESNTALLLIQSIIHLAD